MSFNENNTHQSKLNCSFQSDVSSKIKITSIQHLIFKNA